MQPVHRTGMPLTARQLDELLRPFSTCTQQAAAPMQPAGMCGIALTVEALHVRREQVLRCLSAWVARVDFQVAVCQTVGQAPLLIRKLGAAKESRQQTQSVHPQVAQREQQHSHGARFPEMHSYQ